MAYLYLLFTVASDGVDKLMNCSMIMAPLYGLVLFTGGILIFALEMSNLEQRITDAWNAMSAGQHSFFDNKKANLWYERY